MKIAIDIQTTLGQKSGFGFYVKNLVEGLKAVDSKDDFILISPETEKDLSTPQRFMWDQWRFPKMANKAKVDLLHQPCFSAPMFYSGKIVVTCHDIIPLLFPKNLPIVSRIFYSKWMPYTYRAADKIIASSQCTKKDIIEHLHIDPSKITVVHLAVSENFKPQSKDKIDDIKDKYGTGEKYFIHVSTIEPRKNLSFLVEAFALAVKEGIIENLVIVGKKGWYYEGLFELVKRLDLDGRVIFTGYADDDDVPALYAGATALTFPSMYEGFGFPPLEAMACGTPVISSNTSSMPEVVEKAGILLPPKNKKLWAKMMVALATDESISKELSKMGLQQAKKFTWQKTALETVKVYEAVKENN